MPRSTRTPALPDDPAAACAQLAATCTDAVRTCAENYRVSGFDDRDEADARPLVQLALLALAPATKADVNKVGWMAGAHVRACLARGADRTVSGVWASDQVEHTLANALPVTQSSRASLASVLRRASRLLAPAGHPSPAVVHQRRKPLLPYNTDELAALLDAVTTLTSPLWRARASLLVAATAGAGLTSADCAQLEEEHLTMSAAGVLVRVPSADRARVIPVRHEFEHLAAAAHRALRDALAEQPRTARHTLWPGDDAASRCFGKLTWPRGLDRPNTHRLRATWSALTFASGCGLPAFLRAAHITSLDTWMAPTALLPELPFDVYCAQVRGATGPFVPDGRVLDGQPWPSPAVPLRTGATTSPRRTRRSGR